MATTTPLGLTKPDLTDNSDIRIAVNGNMDDIDTLVQTNIDDISQNASDISTNAGNISDNSSDISTLQGDVTTLQNNVSDNSDDINTLQDDVGINTAIIEVSLFATDTGGTSTVYTCDKDGNYTSLSSIGGFLIAITPHVSNTGACTLNIDSTGARSIKKYDNGTTSFIDLVANDLLAEHHVLLKYDSSENAYILS